MTPEKYRRAAALFDKLAGLPSPTQQEQLRADCESDEELRQYLAGLLEAERQAPDSFLARPAVEHAVNRIAERAASLSPVIGTQLGAYVIGRQIGSGGMGAVYEARDIRLMRKVAIKILPPALAGDADRMRRFRRSPRGIAAESSEHRLDLRRGTGSGAVPTSLRSSWRARRCARWWGGAHRHRRFLDIAIQIARALGAAHRPGIVHRDIKPENVIRRPDGIVKVLDFGLAKLADPGRRREAGK